MKKQYWVITICAILVVNISNVYGLSEEGVVLDPDTGNYLITYYGSGAPGDKKNKILRKVIFVPATKIDPLVKSTFKLMEASDITYSYRITNGTTSRQLLDAMRFDPVTDIVSAVPLPKRHQDTDLNTVEKNYLAGVAALETPDGWTGGSYTSHSGGLRISWSYSTSSGLAQGKSQGGFGFSSKDIPGIGMAQLQGYAPGSGGYPDDGPSIGSEASKQLEPIEQHDFVTRPAAIPGIAVPTPFDAAVMLERIQTQAHTWIGLKLLDPTFSAQLDTSFKSAIDAYRNNQPKSGKPVIKTLRELLKNAYPDLDNEDLVDEETSNNKGAQFKNGMITRLAARVLDFDLQYVLKQLGED